MTAIATLSSRGNRRRHLLVVPATTTASGPATSSIAPHWSALVLRMAVAADDPQLRRLAHLDSARPLSGQALIAEQAGSIVAALSLDDGATIADPFVASADAVTMLRMRAGQLNRGAATAA